MIIILELTKNMLKSMLSFVVWNVQDLKASFPKPYSDALDYYENIIMQALQPKTLLFATNGDMYNTFSV